MRARCCAGLAHRSTCSDRTSSNGRGFRWRHHRWPGGCMGRTGPEKAEGRRRPGGLHCPSVPLEKKLLLLRGLASRLRSGLGGGLRSSLLRRSQRSHPRLAGPKPDPHGWWIKGRALADPHAQCNAPHRYPVAFASGRAHFFREDFRDEIATAMTDRRRAIEGQRARRRTSRSVTGALSRDRPQRVGARRRSVDHERLVQATREREVGGDQSHAVLRPQCLPDGDGFRRKHPV